MRNSLERYYKSRFKTFVESELIKLSFELQSGFLRAQLTKWTGDLNPQSRGDIICDSPFFLRLVEIPRCACSTIKLFSKFYIANASRTCLR